MTALNNPKFLPKPVLRVSSFEKVGFWSVIVGLYRNGPYTTRLGVAGKTGASGMFGSWTIAAGIGLTTGGGGGVIGRANLFGVKKLKIKRIWQIKPTTVPSILTLFWNLVIILMPRLVSVRYAFSSFSSILTMQTHRVVENPCKWGLKIENMILKLKPQLLLFYLHQRSTFKTSCCLFYDTWLVGSIAMLRNSPILTHTNT